MADQENHELDTIAKFLRRNVEAETEQRAELLQQGERDSIGVYIVDAGMPVEALNALAAEIYEDAAGIAEVCDGVQRFGVRLFREKQRDSHARCMWALQGGGGADSQLMGTEPPNPTGLTRALMRHLEARERTFHLMFTQLFSTQSRELKHARDELHAMDKQRVEMHQLMEDLQSQKHTREMERDSHDRWEKRVDSALQAVQLLLPAVATHVSRKLGGPAITHVPPESLQLRALLQSLDRDQLEAVLQRLDQPQQLALLQLMKQHGELPKGNTH